jgi:hypothetical protein
MRSSQNIEGVRKPTEAMQLAEEMRLAEAMTKGKYPPRGDVGGNSETLRRQLVERPTMGKEKTSWNEQKHFGFLGQTRPTNEGGQVECDSSAHEL